MRCAPSRPGEPALAFPGLLMLLLAVFLAAGIAGCAPADGDSGSASSSAEDSVEEETVSLRVMAPAALEGVLQELGSAYASDKDWLSFDWEGYPDSASLNLALAPDAADTSGSALPTMGSASSSLPASSSSSSASPQLPGFDDEGPRAELVFEDSLEAMDVAEAAGAVDPATRVDMLQDGLVLAVGDGSPLSAANVAELQAGLHRMAVVVAADAAGESQREVLANLGLYADGAFVGGLAPAAPDADPSASALAASSSAADLPIAKVVEVKSVSEQFSALGEDPDLVAIVRTSDLYRYGGTKVVGDVPSELYAAIRYPMAAANPAESEDGARAARVSRDFLRWVLTDGDALRIIEKWGFFLGA